LSPLVNPLITVSELDSQPLNRNLQAAADDTVLGKRVAGLAVNLAALTSPLAAKQVLEIKPGNSQQGLPAIDPASTLLPAMPGGPQTAEQVMPELTGKFVAMAERAAVINKADTAALNISQPGTQAGNDTALNFNSLSMLSGGASRADVTVATPAPVSVTPQNPAWTQQVGERIQWMVNQQMQKAEIRLDPPELGSLEVRVVMQKDHAQVSFAAPHIQVRDALEAAIPRLREMLMDQGLNLADVDIGQHSFAEQQQQHREGVVSAGLAEQDSVASNGEGQEKDNDKSTLITSSNGLLDTYV
jgi:flagellar hook-length control protein FliK